MRHEKSEYEGLIREAINYRLDHDFAFGYIIFKWVYAFPYVTIVDRITQLYLEACEGTGSFDRNSRDPFDFLRAWMRFDYGTPYIANIIYRIAEYYEFEYNHCMKCAEHGTFCGMDECEVRECMQQAENRHWADLADPFGDD